MHNPLTTSQGGALPGRYATYDKVERWAALIGAGILLSQAARRKPIVAAGLTLAALPLAYRGIGGRWPGFLDGPAGPNDDTRVALAGAKGQHIQESIRVDRPVHEVYRFWRRLENLPQFMSHLNKVTPYDNLHSRWSAKGPGGVPVEWDAEIINEVEDQVIGWRSLPGSDIVTAGSVHFQPILNGRSTELSVHLQYEPPGGRAGALVATLFGANPSQMIREDLQRLLRLLAVE
jgi:uncharacterized membrane protein